MVIIIIIAIILQYRNHKKENNIILCFAGDTMLGRLVNKRIDKTNYAYPWGNILPILKNTDINIINLETTLSNSNKKIPKVFNFKATPDKVKSLTKASINVVNLANNHILDFDTEGLLETIQTLNAAGIKHVGAGKNLEMAKKMVTIKKNGIKIGVIGYTDYPKAWAATKEKTGTNFIQIGSIQKIKNDIKTAKKNVDILIITIHWGPNMRQQPPKEFQDFAHQIINAGADIIHGHSAHIFQGVEVYKDKLIMYDTGDFVDDYKVDSLLRNDQSFLFLVTVNKTGIKKIKLIPLLISNMQVNKAEGEEKKEMIKKIKKLSAEFNTHIDKKNMIEIK